MPRARYRYLTGGLEGYVNASLSYRYLSDYNITTTTNQTYCRIWDQHEPFKPTQSTQEYYIVLMSRFVFVVAYEHVVFFIIFVIHWLIPDVPKRIQDQIEREALITQRALWEVRPQDNVINNFLTRIAAKNNNTSTANLNHDDQTRLSVEGLRSRVEFQSQESNDDMKMRDMSRENYLSNEKRATRFSSILTKQKNYSDAYSDEEEEEDNDQGGNGEEWADNQNEDDDDNEKQNPAKV